MKKQQIRKLPKADLHNHLVLGAKRSTINTYLDTKLIFPQKYNGLTGMHEIISEQVNTRIINKTDLTRFMECAVEDAITDGCILLEASVDINLIRYCSNDIKELIQSVAAIRRKYNDTIEFKPDIGIKKISDKDFAYEMALACMESGEFFGIDVYGEEKDQPVDKFIELYKIANNNNIKTKVHMGEFSGPETINEAIDKLEPKVIQHGISAASSNELVQKIKDKNILLNICPESNIALGAVDRIENHPIRKLFDQGVSLTINTDDLLLFDATISDQYCTLLDANIFTFDELNTIRTNSLVDARLLNGASV